MSTGCTGYGANYCDGETRPAARPAHAFAWVKGRAAKPGYHTLLVPEPPT